MDPTGSPGARTAWGDSIALEGSPGSRGMHRHDGQGGGHRTMAEGPAMPGQNLTQWLRHRGLLLIGLTMELHSLYTLQHSG